MLLDQGYNVIVCPTRTWQDPCNSTILSPENGNTLAGRCAIGLTDLSSAKTGRARVGYRQGCYCV